MKPYAYLNGKIVKTDKPHIMLDDIGILRGFGAFDFLRIYNNKPFLFKDHFKRFQNSSKLLGLKVPISFKKLENILQDLLKKNKCKDAHVRLILAGGKTREGLLPSKPNFYIFFEELVELPKKLFKEGAVLITNDHQRLFPEAKTTNYLQAVSLQKKRKRAGAVEVLYINNGYILEATTSNVFILKNNQIITPKENILEGMTKRLIIKLAKEAGYKVIERKIKVSELYKADEVFLTATNKKVLPIVKIDNKIISKKKVGEISKKLLELYKKEIN